MLVTMTSAPVRISATDARRMAIAAQRLVAPPNSTPGGVLEVTRDIGYLQLDPTNVVARNPLLVLWSRLGVYDRVRVEIDGVPSRAAYYGLAELPTLREVREQWGERTTLLSPFDNLIIDRDRTEALFGYRYRMEIYVPPHLRKLGYWAMPVLHGDRIVGSVDPRVDRARGELVVNRVVLAPGAPRSAMPAIRRATGELAVFVGAKRVVWPS